ncbi:metacaspase [Angomonas deanei]|uniref:Caspase domain containing protein, putative n=1 Tax=Angomonas deanei TaxID=59799 RepID=A0A7G2CNU6_9TRYP|nr:metacaspase [Angomonas deanei]CAD2220621.1 Caspase domain containing protein, putative [Angomonas deanei]|eukprot:EPY26379.1 metacaspase [Angomonas deanei]
MGFDLNCIKSLLSGGNANVIGRALNGQVDWVAIGKMAFELAKPYVVQYIGEVPRPSNVNINQAFQDAATASGTKPYEVPAENKYADGNVRALLIGINYYGTSSELSGCVNDVKQELATFQKTGFPVEEMAILVDEKGFPNVTALPTRANIIKYMAWLVKDARKGDVLFMHYSGHGTQTKSNDQYEPYDQVICPSDYNTAGCIIDDDIFKILASTLPKGVRLTVLFDCCHSGSMMDLPYQFIGGNDISSSTDAHMKQVRQNNFSQGDVLMISGCSDSQTSADVGNTATLGNGTSGAGGAGTQCLTYTLLNTKNLSYQDTLIKTRDMLKKKKFEQVPQLSCSKPLDLNAKFSMIQLFTLDSNLSSTLPAQYR